MKESVVQYLKRHHIQFKNKTFLIGVSGGPDSIAILHMLASYIKKEDSYIEAIVIDHQLRKEAADEIKYVTQFCANLGVPVSVVRVNVNKYVKNNKVSIQVAARELRYKAFEKKMREIKADYLVLGHHGDDQIETLVMNMTRAANSFSLIGIPFQRTFGEGLIIRPLLSVSKAQIITYCSDNQLTPQFDASNEDTSYTRNDIRKNVIPKLREKNNQLHLTGQHLNETLIEDEQFIMNKAKEIFRELMFISENENIFKLDMKRLKEYERPLQRRLYRLTLDYLYERELPKSLSYKHEDSFLQLLASKQNKVIDLPHQLRLEKSYEQLLFYFYEVERNKRIFQEKVYEIPTVISLPNGDELTISYLDNFSKENKHSFIIPVEQAEFPFTVRQRKDGDRMRYRGLQGTKKVKDILIDEKIPRRVREQTYVLTNNKEEILWLMGLRKSDIQFDSENQSYILFTYKLNSNKL